MKKNKIPVFTLRVIMTGSMINALQPLRSLSLACPAQTRRKLNYLLCLKFKIQNIDTQLD